VDLVKEVKRFYSQILSFNMTDAQAKTLLDGRFAIRFKTGEGNR
jgi:hypothetical protein